MNFKDTTVEMRKLFVCVSSIICRFIKLLILILKPFRLKRLQNEKGKREIAETVAVNKARELEVQKRTSVMVMSSLSQSICIESTSPTGLIQNSIDTLDYATKVCLFV